MPGKKTIWFSVAGICLAGFLFCLPRNLFEDPLSFVIEDSDGNLLNAAIAADGQWRFPEKKQLPEKFVACITSFEDKRFFSHAGIDPKALGRALVNNLSGRSGRQGGSTITMQVIRISRGNRQRNLFNKSIEMLMALRAEMRFSKMDILSLYASHAPFGGNVVGLDAAAWRYFGRSPDKLSWGDMATLAVLPNAPSLIHPGRNRDLLRKKRDRLIDQLVQNGYLSGSDANLAKMEPLPEKPLALPQAAPHLLQRFIKERRQLSLPAGIRTTLNGELQLTVTGILQRHRQHLAGSGINNLAALVMDVESGHVLAYCGNVARYGETEMENEVDMVQARRSPGSALKPVLFAAALSDGVILPETLLPDIPMDIYGYTPRNFDDSYDGAVPASRALARSLNIPAVYLLRQYKHQRFYDLLKAAGINTLNKPADHYGLSMILGGCEVNMWELAGTYASMARMLNRDAEDHGVPRAGTFHAPLYSTDEKKAEKADARPLFDAMSVYLAFNAMQEVMRPGEEGLWELFSSSRRIAWKTGTSFGFRDAWSVGITPEYVVAVWVGNADGEGKPELVGVKTAAPVMFDIFRTLPATGWFQKPSTRYSYIPVCRHSGMRAGADCETVDTLQMPPFATRSPQCRYHQLVNLDQGGMYRVNESCMNPLDMTLQKWFVLPPAMEHYYARLNHDYRKLPPYLPGCSALEAGNNMELIYPKPGARIFVPTEINGSRGKVVFSATHRNKEAVIFWTIDNHYAGKTQHLHQLAIDPGPGNHSLNLTDQEGFSISCNFFIVDK